MVHRERPAQQRSNARRHGLANTEQRAVENGTARRLGWLLAAGLGWQRSRLGGTILWITAAPGRRQNRKMIKGDEGRQEQGVKVAGGGWGITRATGR